MGLSKISVFMISRESDRFIGLDEELSGERFGEDISWDVSEGISDKHSQFSTLLADCRLRI